MALRPITVSQLNGYVKRVLQSDPLLGDVLVAGEISNLKHHGSGHVYFSLKDENAKVNCFLPGEVFRQLRFEPAEGLSAAASGFVSVYERGGTYSLTIRDMEIHGQGNLSIAFEALKEKLRKEGLFDPKHKKPIPEFPGKIAVITSETGAAVQDILKIIESRSPLTDVLVVPVPVQGAGAAARIAGAIRTVNLKFPETDTIIVGRGGGSIEELWAFNEEIVARSIFASEIPVISAVGHETDVTIADFAADRRAETPTAAAQMAAPDLKLRKEKLDALRSALIREGNRQIRNRMLLLERCDRKQMVRLASAGLDRQEQRLRAVAEALLRRTEGRIQAGFSQIRKGREVLEVLNPAHILKRGYAAVTDEKGVIRSSAAAFAPGDLLTARFWDGQADCLVRTVRREAETENSPDSRI